MRKDFQRSSLFENLGEDAEAAAFEFVGTVFFLLFGLGGIQAATAESATDNTPSTGVNHVMYVATCMGLSLLVSAWLFFRVTGGLFNPNVSLALFLVGGLGPVRFVLYCIAQMVGGIAAAAIVRSLTAAPLGVNTFLAPGINRAQGVFIEMFITAALVIAVLMLAAEKHHATPFAPVGIGLTMFACHLFAVYYTGAAMNTARSFGPAVVSGFPVPNHWVYWLGPFLGSLLGASIYAILKHYRYWNLVPHQATRDFEKSPGDPVKEVKRVLTGKRKSEDIEQDVASKSTSGFGSEQRV
ncbi:Aquaporin-2 [Psilocybe cubensis]|uniref:Aquaporin-like protein n=2 Tax=Psilocybe cubensis TaxID=181762 RepID=A0A8H7XRJ6_PSICU|nr:Aquaporin-2 [Psilocybe cubensis]KAH9474408.1 Aquaporin-2 [Psilocybe cubensis]